MSLPVATVPELRARRPAGAAAVTIERLSKTFRIPRQQYSTLKERALHPFRSTEYDELRAVDDVSLEIAEGEFFGIVGRNGSGKSTLLKCLAGIYRTDSGRIAVRGRLSPFIELGVGFNFDLAARDNTIINAMMLGLSRREAIDRFDAVIAFAELEEFVDLKVKNYSSGMLVRLAFSIAIQVEADVLLIDEVLAVGDAAFQQKCFDEFARLKREGRTIVFVTHGMPYVERFCDRAMLMERGRIVQLGDPYAVARSYHEINFGRLAHDRPEAERPARGSTRILDAWFENEAGQRVSTIDQDQRLRMCFEAEFEQPVSDPVFAITLRNELGHTIVATKSDLERSASGDFQAGDGVVASFEIDNWLAPSRYAMTPSIARAGTGADTLALVEDMTSIVVYGRASGGILEVPSEFHLRRQ